MVHVIELLASWFLTTALTFAIVIADERWLMNEEQLEQAWPPSSRDAAIVAFGPIALFFHFTRTRGTYRSAGGVFWKAVGLVMGVVSFVGVVIIASVLLTLLFWVLGIPEPPG